MKKFKQFMKKEIDEFCPDTEEGAKKCLLQNSSYKPDAIKNGKFHKQEKGLWVATIRDNKDFVIVYVYVDGHPLTNPYPDFEEIDRK